MSRIERLHEKQTSHALLQRKLLTTEAWSVLLAIAQLPVHWVQIADLLPMNR